MLNDQEKIRVLIVEDDHLVGEMIKGILEEAGYTVIAEAISGQEAITLAYTLQPDVILMDIKMPDMDGIEATQHIQDICPTPVVVLTAFETPELVERASQAGVGAYLIKPLNASEIERAITIAVARFEDMQELTRLNRELQKRNAELDAFAHTVAHDLKAQLAPLVGYAEVLEMDYGPTLGVEGLSYLRKIITGARKMGNVVDELLLLSELRATEVPLKPLNMSALVFEAQQRLAHLIKEYEARLTLPDCWPTALGHAPWVEEVWINYLSNGLKYGGRPSKGIPPHLQLGASSHPPDLTQWGFQSPQSSLDVPPSQPSTKEIYFWVQDNGPGIARDEQQKLFVPFAQIDRVRAQGHGLGLSIVRRIVDKLSGKVGVASKVGVGSVFWFTLPAKE